MKNKIHSFIVRFMAYYLKKHCGGATHVYPYGTEGRYIVIMNEVDYYRFNKEGLFSPIFLHFLDT